MAEAVDTSWCYSPRVAKLGLYMSRIS